MGYSIPAVNACQPPDPTSTNSGSVSEKSRRHEVEIIHGPSIPLDSIANAQTYADQGERCKLYMGAPLGAGQLLPCLSWPITSDDVFAGPFGGVTNKPVLVVSNTLDPVTPLVK